jgi:hypothetical protein
MQKHIAKGITFKIARTNFKQQGHIVNGKALFEHISNCKGTF